MGRKLRRLSYRLGVAVSTLAVGVFGYHRWSLRRGSAFLAVTMPDDMVALTATERRLRHREAMARSMAPLPDLHPAGGQVEGDEGCVAGSDTGRDPFDVLVVGGGVTGLYAAVDAAQRGLRVALLEAGDYGCGSTSTQPVVTPGAFPYVQRAIRQRDTRWLRRAYRALEDATVWHNVAPHCMTLTANATTGAASQPAASGTERGGKDAPTTRQVTVSRARTLIPALHSAELVELSVTAWLSTLMSCFAGPIRPCVPLKSSSVVNGELPRHGEGSGGVVVHDSILDGSKAAISLARTAEALGVALLNYTEVVSLAYEEDAGAAASPCIIASALDSGTPGRDRHVQLRARGVINCAGAGVDAVRAQVPDNVLDMVPTAFDRFHAYSYLVAPRSALFRTADAAGSDGAGVEDDGALAGDPPHLSRVDRDRAAPVSDTGHSGRQAFQWLAKPGAALQVASTRYSFSAMFATPWYDDTVLLGPSITPLAAPCSNPKQRGDSASGGRQTSGGVAAANGFLNGPTGRGEGGAPSPAHALRSADGFQAQREHIVRALRSCGVGVQRDQVLSCLSTVVPLLKSPLPVPFADDVLVKGHHIHTFHPAEDVAGRNGSGGESGGPPATRADCAKGLTTPFVHVYGGTSLAARRIAEEAVDALLHKTTALSECDRRTRQRQRAQCRTRNLRLLDVPYESSDCGSGHACNAAAEVPEKSAAQRLDDMVKYSYVVHLTDVLSRRLHVAHTSPAEAVQAAPGLSKHVASLLAWPQRTVDAEVQLANRFVAGIAVRQQQK